MDKVICVGKNYLKHAWELKEEVPSEPVYFMKPPSTIVTVAGDGQVIELPKDGEIHHEVELVFELRTEGTGFRLARWTIGLDLTKRDVQGRLKKAGLPWEKGKVFPGSTVLGPWKPVDSLLTVLSSEFSIMVNGEVRQVGRGQNMRWQPEETVRDLMKWFPLSDGDLLFTGTPEGVAELKNGDDVLVQGAGLKYAFKVKRG